MSDAEIGSLLIRLQASTAELDQQIKATRGNFTDLHDTIGTVKEALAAFGVFEGIKAIIGATADAEKAQALLASQIKATGDASGLTEKQLTDMAEGFSASTTSSREEVEKLEAELLAFRNIGHDQFQGVIQAALDFSAVTGHDATEAVRALGMALDNPAANMKRLARAGIDLDDATKFTIKSLAEQGDLIGAQNILLEQMQKSYGGAAAAMRDTLGGAITGLKNDFKEMLVGSDSATQSLTDSIKALDVVIKDPSVKEGIASLAAGILGLATLAAKAAAAFGDFGRGLGEGLAKAMGNVGGFDDQIKSLNGNIAQTSILLAEANKADPSGQSPAIAALQRQLAQYKYQLQDIQLYQDALLHPHGQDLTAPPTSMPSLPDMPMIDTDHMAKIGNPIAPIDLSKLTADQSKVVAIWKQMDPSSYIKEQTDAVNALVGTVVGAQVFTQEQANTRIAQLEEEWKRHTDAMTEATQSAAQGMQQDLQQFFFDPVNEGLGGLLKAFVNTLREMLAQWAAAQVFNSAFGSYDKTGQGGGAAGFGDMLAGFFGGHRAGGGPVSAGMLYQVNEAGAGTEGFIPSGGGQIVPLGRGGGGKGVGDVNITQHIDARGADGTSAAQLLQMLPALRRMLHSDVEHYASRGVWPA